MLTDSVRNVLIDCLHVGDNDDANNIANMRTLLANAVEQSPKPDDTWANLSNIFDRLLPDKREQYERAKILNKMIKERI